MNDNYLMHYGKKGMRWGKRTQTYGPEVKRTGPSVDSLKNAKKNVDSASSIVDSSNKMNKTIKQKKSKSTNRQVVTQMTDKELQSAVNRLNMEERYVQVMGSREAEVGKNRVDKMLDGAGTALALGSSALTIMLAVKELQK